MQSEKGILVGAPFGRASIDAALMDAKMKNKYGRGKYLLRHAFEGKYLPHDIKYREKAE